MIKAVRCDKSSFKEIHFSPGFNVVLAERTEASSDKDSRNGLGKSTLIEIIHFCLGADATPNKGLRVPELEDWTFFLDLTLNNRDLTVARNTKNFGHVKLEGDFSTWPVQPEFNEKEKAFVLKIKDWNLCLGYLFFGLEPEIVKQQYSPTFRSLFSYFARRGTEGFANPFAHHSQQKPWDIQVNNAWLLGLNWEYAAQFQILKDKEKLLKDLGRAAKQGILTGYLGSIGELEAERTTLSEQIEKNASQLKSFKVHPQYTDIQNEANILTAQTHAIVNEQTMNKRLLEQYQNSITEEKDVPVSDVELVYTKAGVVFSDVVKKRLEDVVDFHQQIVGNRKSYLQDEIKRLQREIEQQSATIKNLGDKRAGLLQILQTHGALDEYTKLNRRQTDLQQQLSEIENRIKNLKQFETGISNLKIEREELRQKARRDFEERQLITDNARRLFNANSEYLYAEPGSLIIDLTDTGYKFDIDIKRAGSLGIGYMKVFCYDLMLIKLQKDKSLSPGLLIHDSTIFNGVDERQVAKALELAMSETDKNGFQYIVTLNSDQAPRDDFSDDAMAQFEDGIKIKFTDATDEGGLLGVRY